jgi:hypothetical protein
MVAAGGTMSPATRHPPPATHYSWRKQVVKKDKVVDALLLATRELNSMSLKERDIIYYSTNSRSMESQVNKAIMDQMTNVCNNEKLLIMDQGSLDIPSKHVLCSN